MLLRGAIRRSQSCFYPYLELFSVDYSELDFDRCRLVGSDVITE